MDGLTLTSSVLQLRSLIGGKVEKIQQPEKYELLFSFHTSVGSSKVIISSSSENCRIHITDEKRVSPIDAPNFLMLLRKHLLGSKLIAIEQPMHDRIVLLKFEGRTELQDSTVFTLACEIMGRHSNIILVDQSNRIIDSIRRISAGMSSVRLVLPRLDYELPPMQEKLDPEKLTLDALYERIKDAERMDKALASSVCGLSPLVADLIIETLEASLNGAADGLAANEYDAAIETACRRKLSEAIIDFYRKLFSEKHCPTIAFLGEKRVLLPFTPSCAAKVKRFERVSEAADEFYRTRAELESVKRRTASLERVLQNAIQRLERKSEKFALAIGDEAEIEKLKLFGELLTVNMYALPERAESAEVENYYLDPPASLTIPLDETISISDNAQLYYKKYRKAKSARDIALVMRKETLEELEYLRGVEADLVNCLSDSDFDEVRGELSSGGYIRENRRKNQKLPRSKPHSCVSSDGFTILIGKNNVQNDRLTFKESSPEDIWMHTKDIHGSHVIIRCDGKPVPDATLTEAALLAAFHSQAKNSALVPVDMTKRKFVKKPAGAKPGMVIYTHQRTVYVTPEAELIEKLLSTK